jgi:hypothetical protein
MLSEGRATGALRYVPPMSRKRHRPAAQAHR